MASANKTPEQPLPRSAALKSLDRLVGTWKASDPSGAEGIHGQVIFEWMEGHRFLIQHVDLDGAKGIEIIGYDEERATLGDDGNSYTGRWEWTQDGVKMGYDATMTRASR